MPNDLITQYLTARRKGDRLAIARVLALVAEYDAHNPFGPRLLDEIRGLHQPAAA